MKLAVYYRVSTDRQDIRSQRNSVERWIDALEEGPKKFQEFIDEGVSGASMKRPAFNKMIADAIAGKFDTIAVYRLDRFSRSSNQALQIILKLEDHGVAFVAVSQPALNLGHEMPFRKTILACFSELAQLERETIVARVKEGLEAARRRGIRLGPPIKLNDDKISEIVKLRQSGKTMKQIAQQVELSVGSVCKVLKGFSENEEQPNISAQTR